MKTWTTRNGETIPIKEMSNSHLLNTIKFIERKAKDGLTVRFGGDECGDPWYDEDTLQGDEVFNWFGEYKFLVRERKRRVRNGLGG